MTSTYQSNQKGILGSGFYTRIKELCPSVATKTMCLAAFLDSFCQVLICNPRNNCSSSHVPYSLIPLHLSMCAPSGWTLPSPFICSLDCSFIHNLVESCLSKCILRVTSSRKPYWRTVPLPTRTSPPLTAHSLSRVFLSHAILAPMHTFHIAQ